MSPVSKSTIVGIILVLLSAIGGGVGIATLVLMPFGYPGSIFVGSTYIVSAMVCWGWACFARPQLF